VGGGGGGGGWGGGGGDRVPLSRASTFDIINISSFLPSRLAVMVRSCASLPRIFSAHTWRSEVSQSQVRTFRCKNMHMSGPNARAIARIQKCFGFNSENAYGLKRELLQGKHGESHGAAKT